MSGQGEQDAVGPLQLSYARPVDYRIPLPRWAWAVGGLSILIGGYGLICLSLALSKAMHVYIPKWLMLTRSSGLIGGFRDVLLVVAGCGLLLRWRMARSLHILHGWLAPAILVKKLSFTVTAAPFIFWYDGSRLPAVVFMACGSVVHLLYPIFTIWWFSRRAIRRRMADWRLFGLG